jgi:hypothetical protein
LPAGPRVTTFDRTIEVVASASEPVIATLAGVLTPEECGERRFVPAAAVRHGAR